MRPWLTRWSIRKVRFQKPTSNTHTCLWASASAHMCIQDTDTQILTHTKKTKKTILDKDLYSVGFVLGTRKPKTVYKWTQVSLSPVCSLQPLDGPASSTQACIFHWLPPWSFSPPPHSHTDSQSHCSVPLLKAKHTVAGPRACGCVCLRLRFYLLSDNVQRKSCS